MPYRPFRLAPWPSSTGRRLSTAALLCLACSVFPDEATLPKGQGGSSGGGSAGGFVGGGGGQPNPNGGRAEGGSAGGAGGDSGSLNGGSSSEGGAGGDAAGFAGSGGDEGGAADGGAAGGGAAGGGQGPEGGAKSGGTGGVAQGGTGGSSLGGQLGQGGGGGQGGSAGCATPVVQLVPASFDAYITNAGNDDRSNFGDAQRLLLSGVPMSEAHALLNFDWTLVPSQGVRHLKLRVVLAVGFAGTRTVSVYRVGRDWAEDKVTWVRASNGAANNWTTEGGDRALSPSATQSIADAPAGKIIEFALDSDPMLLSTPASENYGLLLEVGSGQAAVELSSSESLFTEERPALVLELCP